MNEDNVTVSYFVHEGEMARLERINKRLAIISVLLSVVLAFNVLLMVSVLRSI